MEIVKGKKPRPASLKLAIVLGSLNLGNFFLNGLRGLIYKKNPTPSRILIFRTGSLGDNLCAIPSILAVRKKYPLAHLDILSNAGKNNLVTLEKLLASSYYNQIIDYFGFSKKALFHLLRDNHYDLIVYLPQADVSFFKLVRDMFFFRAIGNTGFGWKKSMIPFFRRTQEKYIAFDNEISRLGRLMKENGLEINESEFGLHSTDADEQLVSECFRKHQLTDKNKNIALVIGAKRPQNRWPLNYFKEVIDHFHHNYNIIIIGGPEDRSLTGPLLDRDLVFDFCGKFTPVQSALAFKKCLITLSNDTGPMHLSYAVGTPTIALFSSRDLPGKWYPPASPKNRVFRTAEVHCSVCYSETCSNNICMKAIQPSTVIQAMEEMISTINRSI